MSGLPVELKELRQANLDKVKADFSSPLPDKPKERPKPKKLGSESFIIPDMEGPKYMDDDPDDDGPLSPEVLQLEQVLLAQPEEDELTVVFPWSEDIKAFSIEEEQRARALGFVTQEEIDLVFGRLRESLFYDLYGKMHYRLAVPILAALLLVCLLYYLYKDVFTFGSAVLYFCLTMTLLLGLGVAASMYWNRYVRNRLKQREEDFQRILGQLNREVFLAKDLSWRCGHFGTFVELDLNLKAAKLQVEQWARDSKEPVETNL